MASNDEHAVPDSVSLTQPGDAPKLNVQGQNESDPHVQENYQAENDTEDGSAASSENVDEDEDPLAHFSAVISAFNLDLLPQFAAKARQKLHPNAACGIPTVGDPMYGSYHIIYPLTFGDGVQWVIKIPRHGVEGKWDNLSAASLSSEANTMRLLKRETTIPLPDVFDFSTSIYNELGCPYILTSFISGRPLQEVWFSQLSGVTDPDALHSHRVRALEGIASAMAQLGRYTSFVGGAPLFNANGEWDGLGPMQVVDVQAELDRFFIHGDSSSDPIHVEQRSSVDMKWFYTFLMDLHPEPTCASSHPKGMKIFLHHLISWFPKPVDPKPFVLTHPDFDIQNILVSEDGQLQGIIDWEGVAAVPRNTGNEALPSWLTRDWDPMMYRFSKDDFSNNSSNDESSGNKNFDENGNDEESDEDEDEDENEDEDEDDKEEDEYIDDKTSGEPLEDSPETLKRYREIYRQCFLDAQAKQASFSDRICSLWTRLSNRVSSFFGYPPRLTANGDITRQSLITQNVAIAAMHPACRGGILMKVVEEVSDILGDDVELDFFDIIEGLAGDELDDSVLENLNSGFEKLLEMSL
ncbi:hypothetical protein EDB81DRAFT_934036 [Dactylonectria macrodidyma]|uniref:Aminoglycoside phosphotransferase domain-containing protein n=1 Tax=Dactylonectria macrodidyma TaxID=307937 RepID=A0A9P9J8D7_9HYPO|nr:hypothetical protein EDB81DRAFT_934036 [Dactylonectria macrodidyma]